MFRLVAVLFCLASSAFALKLGLNVELAPSRPDDAMAASAFKGEDEQYAVYAYAQNFHQAYEFCLQRGMELASFDNDEEYNQIKTLLNEKGENTMAYWTSGTDLGEKDHYIFYATGHLMAAPQWAEGQPNHDAEGSEEARCVALAGSLEYRSILVPCSQALYVVCEKDEVNAAAAAAAAAVRAVAAAAEE